MSLAMQKVMVDPVMLLESGDSYERDRISTWIETFGYASHACLTNRFGGMMLLSNSNCSGNIPRNHG